MSWALDLALERAQRAVGHMSDDADATISVRDVRALLDAYREAEDLQREVENGDLVEASTLAALEASAAEQEAALEARISDLEAEVDNLMEALDCKDLELDALQEERDALEVERDIETMRAATLELLA